MGLCCGSAMLCVRGCPAGTLDSAHLEPEMTPSQDHPNICRFYQEILKELKKNPQKLHSGFCPCGINSSACCDPAFLPALVCFKWHQAFFLLTSGMLGPDSIQSAPHCTPRIRATEGSPLLSLNFLLAHLKVS